MAQPAGYSNDRPTTTPSDLGERIENARLVVNGQPPQFGKMSSFVGAKPMRTAFASQEALNSPGLAVSNGPPVAHNYSNPGSLSSHSSRNASPTPPARYGGVSQSLENLSQSTGVLNNHPPQHRNVTGISRVPQHPSSNEPTVRKTFSPLPVTGTNVHTDSDPGAVGHPHIPGQKNSVEPPKTVSFPFNPHQHSQNLPQNIPSSDNLNENSRISAGKPPMQHSSVSLSSATRTSQVHTQASFNGPVPTYPQHKNHTTYSSPQSNAPVSSFPNSPSLNSSSNTKPVIPPTSQLGQNPGVIKTGPSHQTPVSPYSGIPPGSSSFVSSGQTPGTLVPQFALMPSESPAGPSKSNPFPFHPQSAAGPSGNNRTAHPGMSLSGASGYNQTPNQQMSYPGMLPASVSQPVYPNMSPSSSGPRQPVSPVYPNMPPSSSVPRQPVPPGYPNMPSNSSGLRQPVPSVYPTMPPNSSGPPVYPSMPPNSSGPPVYPSMPPNSSGPRPPGSQPVPPVYPSMPPTNSGPGPSQPLPSSHPSQFSGTPGQGQPPNSYPGYTRPGISPLPSNSASGDHYQSSRRYPQQPGYQMQSQSGIDGLSGQMSNLSVTQAGFNKLWGLEYYDLLQTRNILPPEKVEPPKIALHQEFLDNVNCSPEIFRCTLTKIPESNSLLQKARLPLGILIHPFKDLNHLPVIQCSTIVRCRACRTYINPFVYFVDQKRWKCNLCFRVNELPEEFQYDPVSKTYGDPTRRPEIKSSTMEFIAPSEYMLRPPQPAVYLFILDVSQLAVESGYLQLVCDILLDELDKLPGDGRTQIGFITCDSTIHFYNLAEGLNQPQQMIVVDTDDIFLPCPDNLLVNLAESRDLIRDLLTQLPLRFEVSHDPFSALGAALQAAFKLMSPTGGRVTVFQSCLPTKGPGALTPREDPSQRAGKEAPHLNPAIDFYKRLALDCSGQQVAVDLFVINSQYCDLATIAGVSRFSGGCIHHFPLFKTSNTLQVENFNRVFRRYLTRKIGFEAVMRIRCSRGLAIHTFHGNFFVRSTDLLSLPNVNPDAGFGMQVSIEESLSELQNVCFQAALLYTTSKGERRIRVHTLCLPVATTLPDILYSADQQCIIGLLAKMAVDRSQQTSLSDAREAFINVAIDVLSAYRVVQSIGAAVGLLAPHNLCLLPLYILSLLKYVAFRSGQSTRLDDRVFAMCQMKTLPLANLIQVIYPDMYPVHCLEEQLVALEDGSSLPQPPRLHLSAEKLDQRGVFLMDTGDHMLLYVGRGVSAEYCSDVLGLPSFSQIPEEMYELPVLETTRSEHLRNFINYLQSEKPYSATIQIIREDGHHRSKFIERLIEDRTESAFSYYEFLQHLKTNVK